MFIILIIQDNIWFPNFICGYPNKLNAIVFSRIPSQFVVIPNLKEEQTRILKPPIISKYLLLRSSCNITGYNKDWKCSLCRMGEWSETHSHDPEKHWTYMNMAHTDLLHLPLRGDAMPTVTHCWHAEIPLSCYTSVDSYLCQLTSSPQRGNCHHASAPGRLRAAGTKADHQPKEKGGMHAH